MSEPASPSALGDLSAALTGLVAGAAPSLVSVHSHRSQSSGFVWRRGLIVTADEALADEGEVAVAVGNSSYPARIVGRDPTTDVALLRIERFDAPPVVLAAPPIEVGALALMVGAEESGPTAALGIVSHAAGPWRSMRGGEIDARIELDLRARRSAEGGLVVDAAGRAIGMAVFGPRQRVLVIPSATIERVAPKLESDGRVARGYLGLGLQPVPLQDGEGIGAMVMSVDPEGPGAAAGLYQGDVLVTWDGSPIRDIRLILRALGPGSVGRPVTLGVRRGGELSEVTLTIAERP